ncbi:MAG: N-6 DNA methylase, partial [Bacteroides sp.]
MLLFDDAIDIDSVLISDAARDLAISTATVRNWIKTGLLESSNRGCVSRKSLDSLKKNLEQGGRLSSRANKSKKGEQNYSEVSASIQNKLESNPFNEAIVSEYERALSESYRNKEGIYYTSSSIVTDMLRDSLVDETTTFLDPCCGCGNFIMGAIERGVRVENIYGFDTDKTAIRIAKQRIYAKTGREAKNIVCADFLTIAQELHQSFDLIYTN